MTLTGQNIIDLFYESLDSKSSKTNKRIMTERDSEILRKYYDFDENQFSTMEEVGQVFQLSRERISQLHNRSLKKIKYAAKELEHRNSPSELLTMLYEGVESCPGENNYLKLVNFYHENLPEFPGERIIRLFSNLFYSKKNEITENIVVFKGWKKEQIKLEKQEQLRIYREEKNKVKLLELQDSILDDVIWFDKKTKWQNVDFKELKPKRQVNRNSDYITGEYKSGKCQRKIQYESGIELNFILMLERFPKVKYYIEQPTTIEYQRIKKDYKYTPDFVFFLENNEAVIVEIKDFNGMTDVRVQRKIEALIEYCKIHGFGLLLTNGFATINYLLSKSCNLEFEKEIIKKLNKNEGRIIFFKEFKLIQKKYNVQWIDFLSMVIRNNLGLYPFPFKLTLKNNYFLFRETMIKPTYNK